MRREVNSSPATKTGSRHRSWVRPDTVWGWSDARWRRRCRRHNRLDDVHQSTLSFDPCEPWSGITPPSLWVVIATFARSRRSSNHHPRAHTSASY